MKEVSTTLDDSIWGGHQRRLKWKFPKILTDLSESERWRQGWLGGIILDSASRLLIDLGCGASSVVVSNNNNKDSCFTHLMGSLSQTSKQWLQPPLYSMGIGTVSQPKNPPCSELVVPIRSLWLKALCTSLSRECRIWLAAGNQCLQAWVCRGKTKELFMYLKAVWGLFRVFTAPFEPRIGGRLEAKPSGFAHGRLWKMALIKRL